MSNRTQQNPISVSLLEETAGMNAAKALCRALTELLEAGNASFLLDHVEGNWEECNLDGIRTTAIDAMNDLLPKANEALASYGLTIKFDRLYGEYRVTKED